MKFIPLLLLLFICSSPYAQNISARYSIIKTVELEPDEPSGGKTAVLDYEGFFYKKGSTYISFLKPLYLDKYPTGYIEVSMDSKGADFTSKSYGVNMDTMQYIYYLSIDSLILRNRMNGNAKLANILPNTIRQFVVDYQKWEILPEVKTIQGLKCQRARNLNTINNTVQYDVWFCADIPTESNFNNLVGLPGLIIEGECTPWKMKFQLQSYQLNAIINDAEMWPAEFNENFKTLKAIKKIW